VTLLRALPAAKVTRWGAHRGAWCTGLLGLCLLASGPALAQAQHTIGPSYQLTVIHAKSGNDSVLQAPGITYAATLGGAWGFQGTFTAYFPVSAYQNDAHVSISDVYSSAWGVDAVFAIVRRICFVSGLQLDIGIGPHFDGVAMKGKRFSNNTNGFSDFSSFTLGVGATAVLRWRVGSGPLSIGAFGSGAVDFVDLLHKGLQGGGDLSIGYGVTTGALVGFDIE
jgi:hypothetical protein